MITFIQSMITEVMKNRVGTRHGIGDDFKFSPKKGESFQKSLSSSGTHTIYTKHSDPNPFAGGTSMSNHFWVNNKTGNLDFHVRSETKPGKIAGERLYHSLDTSGRVGAKLGHHAYWDLMSGRTGDAAIMVHDNMSKGATKLQRKIRKIYGDKVHYHQFDPVTKKAKPHDHGVSSSFGIAMPGEKITPYNLHKKIGRVQVVGMVPPKHRYKKDK